MGSESCTSHPRATSRAARAIAVYKTLHSEILLPWHLLNLCETCCSSSSIYRAWSCYCDRWLSYHLPFTSHTVERSLFNLQTRALLPHCWAFPVQPPNRESSPQGSLLLIRSGFGEAKTRHVLPPMSLVRSNTPISTYYFLFSGHASEIHYSFGGSGVDRNECLPSESDFRANRG